MILGRALMGTLAVLFAVAPAAADRLKVVASFSIIGDMAERVAGDNVELKTLVGPDGDAHTFEPTPGDAQTVAAAQVFLVNGLDFEPWAQRLATSTNSKARVVVVSEGIKPRPFHEPGGAASKDTRTPDPHAWQDLGNATLYVQNIARALIAADKTNAKVYQTNAHAYLDELRTLDTDIRAAVGMIPSARRRVITTHDAFAYFGAAYGVQFIAPLGTSTEEQASAKEVAALIRQIRREHITAVFVENISDPRLVQQIAKETGTKLGGKLYSDALSTKTGPAPTYVAMMRHNVRLLTGAMARGL